MRDKAGLSVRSGRAACAALLAAFCLGGCDDTAVWFAKPFNGIGSNSGYTYSQLGDTRQDRPITANDLIDAGGACPAYVPPAPATASAAPADGGADTSAIFGGGIALGMSECEVVSHLGRPTAVNLGQAPTGARATVLTFQGGPRPGVYRFNNGRLAEMDRVEGETPAPKPDKKAVKKKPAASPEPQKSGDKS
jgi:hypothetical protein